MLRDYELALSNYRLISTDYKLDKAWKRYAGVQVGLMASGFFFGFSFYPSAYVSLHSISLPWLKGLYFVVRVSWCNKSHLFHLFLQEMMGLAYFMLDQSRKDAEYCMENAFTTYLVCIFFIFLFGLRLRPCLVHMIGLE